MVLVGDNVISIHTEVILEEEVGEEEEEEEEEKEREEEDEEEEREEEEEEERDRGKDECSAVCSWWNSWGFIIKDH